MTYVLRDEDIDRLPAMRLALEAIEATFAARMRGELVSPPRHNVEFPGLGDLVFTIGGTTGEAPVAGFRAYDTFSGDRHTQIVGVWSADSGSLDGVVIGDRLGEVRTGAIGGIAIRHMSAPDAHEVGVIGTGPQSRAQLQAAAAVRPLRSVRVFSRSELNRAAFAAAMHRELEIPVTAAMSAREAVEGADIVICATSSPTPVIEGWWLKRGAHVNTVGPKTVRAHEIGVDVAESADVIATDSPEQTRAYRSPFFLDGSTAAGRVIDLAAIVSGSVIARPGGNETTLFCSTGLAGTEVLVASKLLAAWSDRTAPRSPRHAGRSTADADEAIA